MFFENDGHIGRHLEFLGIVIVISKFLKRYSEAKRTRAPAYSRVLRRIKGSQGVDVSFLSYCSTVYLFDSASPKSELMRMAMMKDHCYPCRAVETHFKKPRFFRF